MTDVSIIVPTYNAEDTLERCIDSLIAQTYTKIEIIIVDDGSKDNTRLIAEQLLKKDNKIVYIYQDNKGVSEARNLGMKVAKGKWIAFCDSDDYVERNYIELMMQCRMEYDSEWVIAGFKKRIGDEEYIFENPYSKEKICFNLEAFASDWYKNPYIAGVGGALYNAEIIRKNNLKFPKGIHHGEDTIFNIKYFYYCKKVSFVNEPIYIYMDKENSLTSIFREDIWENQEKILNEFSLMCSKKGYTKKIRELFLVRCITLSLNSIASHRCNKQIWYSMCHKIRSNENFKMMNLKYKEIDAFGAIVIYLLNNNKIWILQKLFKIKIFMYSNLRGIYYVFRRK